MADEQPPIPGRWEQTTVANTGPWTIGPVWIDRHAQAYCMRVEDRHCNAIGAMHGGAIATFLDSQVIATIDIPDLPGAHCPTISLHVDYMAPPASGDWLVARVELVKTTRTMIFTQAIASVGERAMARSHAIYKNNPRKDLP